MIFAATAGQHSGGCMRRTYAAEAWVRSDLGTGGAWRPELYTVWRQVAGANCRSMAGIGQTSVSENPQ